MSYVISTYEMLKVDVGRSSRLIKAFSSHFCDKILFGVNASDAFHLYLRKDPL